MHLTKWLIAKMHWKIIETILIEVFFSQQRKKREKKNNNHNTHKKKQNTVIRMHEELN